MAKIFKVISDEFRNTYKDKKVPFGPLGFINYKRTYARRVEGENRTETWAETCQRVINGNFSLEIHHLGLDCPTKEQIMEAQAAFDALFHLKWSPGGRGLWASGTEIQERHGGALTNCYYVDLKPVNGKVSYPFQFAMDQLMVGAGVGYGVSKDIIQNIPTVKNKVDLHVTCRSDHPDYNLSDYNLIPIKDNFLYMRVKDSREGWVKALGVVINYAFKSKRAQTKTVVLDVSDIRENGKPIRGFGGTASGPCHLVEMLRNINELLNTKVGKQLSSVDCVDIMGLISRCVVAGNIRRSAMIAIGDADDIEFITCKVFGQSPEKDKVIAHHRIYANNSVIVNHPDDLDVIVPYLIANGEPGTFNLDLVQSYGRMCDPKSEIPDKATGTNPCAEISICSYECCNLADVFLPNCATLKEYLTILKIAYRYTKRVTLAYYPWDETREVVQRNRRLGVAQSGIMDKIAEIGWEEKVLWDHISYPILREYDKEFSQYLGINESIKLTTVKPSGTISKLAGVSNGIHYHPAPYYIRRIQFQKNDPLLQQLKTLGFTIKKAVQYVDVFLVEFPMKAPNSDSPRFRTEKTSSLKEQLKNLINIQRYWSDNSVSCTLKFKQEEITEILPLLKEHFYEIKSTTLLPFYDPEELKKQYPDLPEEPITEEEYNTMMLKITAWPDENFQDNGIGFEINNDECAGGHCPVK